MYWDCCYKQQTAKYFFHLSLPRFYAMLKRFFCNTPQLLRYGPLDGLHAFKIGALDDPFVLAESHMEQDPVNWVVVPVRLCSFQPGTAHPVPLLFRHAQIFGDNLPNTVHLTCDHSNNQLGIANTPTAYPLDVDLLVKSCSLLQSSFTSF